MQLAQKRKTNKEMKETKARNERPRYIRLQSGGNRCWSTKLKQGKWEVRIYITNCSETEDKIVGIKSGKVNRAGMKMLKCYQFCLQEPRMEINRNIWPDILIIQNWILKKGIMVVISRQGWNGNLTSSATVNFPRRMMVLKFCNTRFHCISVNTMSQL
jgi:hypothetical protein